MPIFEYKCTKCENTFEKFIMSANKSTEISCPQCQSTEIDRLFSAFGFSSAGSAKGIASQSHASCHSCSSKNCATCH